MLGATLSLCSEKSATDTWTGVPIKLDMSKFDTVPRKCHTPNPSELCQSHSRQNHAAAIFMLKLLSLALDTLWFTRVRSEPAHGQSIRSVGFLSVDPSLKTAIVTLMAS